MIEGSCPSDQGQAAPLGKLHSGAEATIDDAACSSPALLFLSSRRLDQGIAVVFLIFREGLRLPMGLQIPYIRS